MKRLHLCDFNSRGGSRKTRLAGLELADRAKVSFPKAVDGCDPEPVSLTWKQLLLVSAPVVMWSRQPPLQESQATRQVRMKAITR